MPSTVVARTRAWLRSISAVFWLSLFIYIILALSGSASAVPNTELNFQARLLGASGELIPDGDYHVEFKIYDSLAAGASAQGVCVGGGTDDCLWLETRTTGDLVRVENGYLTANLGDVTAFPSTIDWSQQLWITLNIGGNAGSASWDGEMTPRLKVTAVPYAFRAGELQGASGGFTADELVQIAPTAVQTISQAVDAIRVNQTGGGGLLQLQGDNSNVFTVDKTGFTTVAGAIDINGASLDIGTAAQSGALVLNDGSGNTLTLQSATQTGDLVFTLPANAGSAGQCLKTNGSGVLSFGSCGTGGGGGDLQSTYDASSSGVVNLTSAIGGLILRDASTPIASQLLAIQNSGGTANYFSVDDTGLASDGDLVLGGDLDAEVITAGTSLILGGETITDITGVALALGSGTLNVDYSVLEDDFLRINGNSSAGSLTFGTQTTQDLSIETDGTIRSTFEADGDIAFDGNTLFVDALNNAVGVGTITPNESLQVIGGLNIGNTTNTNSGTIRWTGTDFEGYDGSAWVSLTLPSGTAGGDLQGSYPNPTIAPDAVALGTDTTGLYVDSVLGGNGLSVSDSGTENIESTINLSDLTADWVQTGAFDIVLGNSNSGLRILEETGGTYYAELDVGDLTADRTVTLGDEDGTVCIQNSLNCGYVLFGNSTAQIDSSTDRSIFINKTGASGNILELQKDGNGVFTIANSGAVSIVADAASALSVTSSLGVSFFGVDTTGNYVSVGATTADSKDILLVLDTISSEPSGVNGAQYYNSTLGRFRCYENGIWKDCIGTRQLRSYVDNTNDTVATNNTTNYWDTAAENNNSYPKITLSSTINSVFGSMTFQVTATNKNENIVTRVERNIGSAVTCGSGTVVGFNPSVTITGNGEVATSTVTFIDSPATTSQVFYTLCSDSSSTSNGVINKIRITLEEASSTN